MAIWFVLKEAVVFIIACGCFSTAQRDILENFKPNKDNPPELNNFLRDVLKYKEDFKWIRQVAENSIDNPDEPDSFDDNYVEHLNNDQQNQEQHTLKRTYGDNQNKPNLFNNIELDNYNQPNNDAFPFQSSELDYSKQPPKFVRDAWNKVKKKRRFNRKRRGLDLSDYSDRIEGVAEVRITPRSRSGVIEVPGNKYELLRKNERVLNVIGSDNTNKLLTKKRNAQESVVKLNILDDNNQIKNIKRDESNHFILLTLKSADNDVDERSVDSNVEVIKENNLANEDGLWSGSRHHVDVLTIPSLSFIQQITSTSTTSTVTSTNVFTNKISDFDELHKNQVGRSVPVNDEPKNIEITLPEKTKRKFVYDESENVPQAALDLFSRNHKVPDNSFRNFEIEVANKKAPDVVNRLEDQSEPTSAIEQKLLSTKFGLDGKPLATTEPILGLMILPQTNINVRSDFRVKETNDMIHLNLEKAQSASTIPGETIARKPIYDTFVGNGLLGLDQIDIEDPPSVLEQKALAPSFDTPVFKKQVTKKRQKNENPPKKAREIHSNDNSRRDFSDYYDSISYFRSRSLKYYKEPRSKRNSLDMFKPLNEMDYAEDVVYTNDLEKRSEDDNEEEGEPYIGKKAEFRKKTKLNTFVNVEKNAKSIDEYNAQNIDDTKKEARSYTAKFDRDIGEQCQTGTASADSSRSIKLIIDTPFNGNVKTAEPQPGLTIIIEKNTKPTVETQTNALSKTPKTNEVQNDNVTNQNRNNICISCISQTKTAQNPPRNPKSVKKAGDSIGNSEELYKKNKRNIKHKNWNKNNKEKASSETEATNAYETSTDDESVYTNNINEDVGFSRHPSRHKGGKVKRPPSDFKNKDDEDYHNVVEQTTNNKKQNQYLKGLTDARHSKISDDESFAPLELQVEKLNHEVDPRFERIRFLPNSVDSFDDVIEPKKRSINDEEIIWRRNRNPRRWRRRFSRSHGSDAKASQKQKKHVVRKVPFQEKEKSSKKHADIKEWISAEAHNNKSNNCMMELDQAMKNSKECNRMDDSGQLHEAIRGKLASDVVKKVIEKLGENEKLYRRFGSGLHHTEGEGEIESLDSFKTNETAEDIKHTKETLKEIMSALHKIIFDQVHRKTCQKLTPQQSKYLEALTKHSLEEVEREVRHDDGYPLPLMRVGEKTTEEIFETDQGQFLYNYPQRLEKNEVMKRIKLVRSLIDKYNKMTSTSQTKASAIHNYLEHHLKLLKDIDRDTSTVEKGEETNNFDRNYRKTQNEDTFENSLDVDQKLVNEQIQKLGLDNQYKFNVNDIIQKQLNLQKHNNKYSRSNTKQRKRDVARSNRYNKLIKAAEAYKKKRQHEEKLGQLFGRSKKRMHRRTSNNNFNNDREVQNFYRAKFEPSLVLSLDS